MNLALAWDKTDLRIMQKLNTLTNISTFWDDVRKMTKNVHSDRNISRWQSLSEKRFEELEEEQKNPIPW